MPPSLDRTPLYTLPHPLPVAGTGLVRTYVGMREAPAAEFIEDDCIAQQAMKHHLAAQAAMDGHRIRNAERREWFAAAVAVALLIVSLGALLLVNAARFWP